MKTANKIRLSLLAVATGMLVFACTSTGQHTTPPHPTPARTISTRQLSEAASRCASAITNRTPTAAPVAKVASDERVLSALQYPGNRAVFTSCMRHAVGVVRARQLRDCLDAAYLNSPPLNTTQGRQLTSKAVAACITTGQ